MDKQIDEMAKDLCHTGTCEIRKIDLPCNHRCKAHIYATRAIDKGYRKASEVAREIFEEIEAEMEAAIESNYRAKREHKNHSVIPNYDNFNAMCDGKIYAMRGLLDFIAELKKKYTEEEG